MTKVTYGQCPHCGGNFTADHICPGGMLESKKDTPDSAQHPHPEHQPSPIMKFFAYEHLPVDLQEISARIGILAHKMDQQLPAGPEKSAGLRKLLEAKDCFVRASLGENS